jgi:hypothetical protein
MEHTGARLSDMKKSVCLSALVYGKKGCGKTWFAGTAGDRNLFITAGNSVTGVKTLQSPEFQEKVGANPFVVELHEELDENRMPKKATLMDQVCDTIDWWLANRGDEFDTVTVDDATNVRRAALFKGFAINQSAGLSQGWEKTKQHEIPMPGVQDSKGNPIVGDKDIVDTIRPAFTGKTMPDDITVNFDEVWHIVKKGTSDGAVPTLDCYGNNQIMASTRHPGILKAFEPRPNFLEFLERIKKAR